MLSKKASKSASGVWYPSRLGGRPFSSSVKARKVRESVLPDALADYDEHSELYPERVLTLHNTRPIVMGKIPCTELREEDVLCMLTVQMSTLFANEMAIYPLFTHFHALPSR